MSWNLKRHLVSSARLQSKCCYCGTCPICWIEGIDASKRQPKVIYGSTIYRWLYYVRVQTFAQLVQGFIYKHALLHPGDRVGVGVSGGADSVALLRLLVELKKDLGIVLSVVHFNHQLRGEESEQDERFVAGLAREHQLEFHGDRGDVKAHAAEQHLSLEAAARAIRYEYFFRLLREGRMNRIATAHTLDDQAETVLLRLVRGA